MNTETLVNENNTELAAAAPVEKTKIQQKDAVFAFAQEAAKSVNAAVTSGAALKALVEGNKEVRKAVRVRLFEGFKAGTIKLSKSMDDSKLKKYCSSVIGNWLKKDARFK